jgi:hypothetical protein
LKARHPKRCWQFRNEPPRSRATAGFVDASPAGILPHVHVPHDSPWTILRHPATLATLIASLLPALLWVGDTPWIYDEPAELMIALDANQHHQLAFHALSGNFSVWYGPMPIQLLQVLLLISHDPRVLIAIRAGLYATITALSLIWMARSFRLNPWFAVAVVLSPHLWLWNRQLWAAYMAVPCSALAIAAYASFLRRPRGWNLALAVGCFLCLPLIHPQGLVVSLIFAGHLLWTHRSALRRYWPAVAGVILLILLLNARYLNYAVRAVYNHAENSVEAGHPDRPSRWVAASGALLGGRLFSTQEFPVQSLKPWPAWLIIALVISGSLSVPLVWIGFISAVSIRFRREAADPLRYAFACLIVASFTLHAGYLLLLNIPPRPYYLFGGFGPNVLAAGYGLRVLSQIRCAGIVVAMLILGCGGITLGTQWLVHKSGWPAGTMSPTLDEQIALAQALNRYADTTALSDVDVYTRHDRIEALWSLRRLYPPTMPDRRSGQLWIGYRGGGSGRIELRDAPPGPLPPNAKEIQLYPPGRIPASRPAITETGP